MCLIDWALWKERVSPFGIIAFCIGVFALCGFVFKINIDLNAPIVEVQCANAVAKIVELQPKDGPTKKELIYELPPADPDDYFSQPTEYLAFSEVDYVEIGTLFEPCEGNDVQFTMLTSDGIWETYQVCVGGSDVCSVEKRKPRVSNVG